ncbi:hypothetical protein GALL_184720 [mine drainage metagenome]|uniref:Uncharacterized protein n=1 Tax=mine drainage metagenome TaxID=410659 RepID=A0A1J5S5Z9_9ZZZZ
MASIVMNADVCDSERDALMLKEYGEEVMSAGWNPQLALVDASSIEQIGEHANDEERTTVPGVILDYAPEEAIESVRFLRSATIPQCP